MRHGDTCCSRAMRRDRRKARAVRPARCSPEDGHSCRELAAAILSRRRGSPPGSGSSGYGSRDTIQALREPGNVASDPEMIPLTRPVVALCRRTFPARVTTRGCLFTPEARIGLYGAVEVDLYALADDLAHRSALCRRGAAQELPRLGLKPQAQPSGFVFERSSCLGRHGRLSRSSPAPAPTGIAQGRGGAASGSTTGRNRNTARKAV